MSQLPQDVSFLQFAIDCSVTSFLSDFLEINHFADELPLGRSVNCQVYDRFRSMTKTTVGQLVFVGKHLIFVNCAIARRHFMGEANLAFSFLDVSEIVARWTVVLGEDELPMGTNFNNIPILEQITGR